VFRQLVLAGIIAAVSKLDALRVPEETGLLPSSTRQSSAALPVYAKAPLRLLCYGRC
jgi:hypothetical protein